MEEKQVRFMDPLTATPREPTAAPVDVAPPRIEGETTEARIISALRGVYDPEIPVNVYDLGLIYGIDCDTDGHVDIRMTLTAPACPVAGAMPRWVEDAVKRISEVNSVHVELVWDPPWTQENLSEEARLELGLL